MKININNISYTLDNEKTGNLIKSFFDTIGAEYQKIPEDWKFGLKLVARKLLLKLENECRKENKEHAMIFRPYKKSDPVLHLISVISMICIEKSLNVQFCIETNEEYHSVTTLTISTAYSG